MKKTISILALLLYACCLHSPSPAATLNPAASKAYVDKEVAALRSVIAEKSVFTNTLQTIENTYYNTYTNTYYTNNYYSVYNVTTNTRHYVTNYNYSITYKTNFIYNLEYSTNITTEIHNTTNLDVWVTNTVNIVTNDVVFPDPVSYTNRTFAVYGYTGVVIRAVSLPADPEDPLVTSTNAVSFYPRADIADTYTNAQYALSYIAYEDEYGNWHELFRCISGTGGYMFAPANEWYDLGLQTSYEGYSLPDSSSMTLVYASDGMTVDTAFVLQRTSVGDEVRNVREIRYNPTIAAEYAVESRRLVSEDGLQWLDSTGVWWQVSNKYDCPSYLLNAETMLEVEDHTGEIGRFESASWTLQCWDYGQTSPRYLYQLSRKDGMVSAMTSSTDAPYPAEHIDFYDGTSGNAYQANFAMSITNGVVRTNAVRSVAFVDGGSSDALSRFDDESVSTNANRELEIKGFGTASGSGPLVPVKSGNDLVWESPGDIFESVKYLVEMNSTWGFDGHYLYNCYVQIGNNVYAANNGQSTISVANLPNGNYGVGYRYIPSSQTKVVNFGLVSDLQSQNYDAVVYVGTLSSGSLSSKQWGGIHSIPIIFIFE